MAYATNLPASCTSGSLSRPLLAPRPATIVYVLGGTYDAKDTEVTQVRPHLRDVSPLLVGDATTLTDTGMLISIDVVACMGCNVCS